MISRLLLVLAGLGLASANEAPQDLAARQQILLDLVPRLQASFAFIQTASGVVIGDAGEVLTNYHVVYDPRRKLVSERIPVRVGSGYFESRVVGLDPVGDLALLQILGPELPPGVAIAEAGSAATGSAVIALGNPFGTAGPAGAASVSVGIVSADRRFIDAQRDELFPDTMYPRAVQTDAPINPGNSGGPLFSFDGRLLGINGQIRSRTGLASNTGIGLAIPAAQIRVFLPVLRRARGGHVAHGILRGLTLSNQATDRFRAGVGVEAVRAGSSAAAAGLLAGDRILSVDDIELQRADHLRGLLFGRPAGETVQLLIERDEQRLQLSAKLETYRVPDLGLDFATSRPLDLRIKGSQPKLQILSGSLQPGDHLLRIAGEAVIRQDLVPFLFRHLEILAEEPVALTLRRDGHEVEVQVALPARYP